MTATRTILSLGLLAGLLAGTASARAGEAVLFKNGAPQAADLARILWPAKKQAQGAMGATRSTGRWRGTLIGALDRHHLAGLQ